MSTTLCFPHHEKVLKLIEKLKDRLETVDLGDVKFLPGMRTPDKNRS